MTASASYGRAHWLLGYARVSTSDQDTSIQQANLRDAGCIIIRDEKAAGKARDGGSELKTVMTFIRPGGTLRRSAITPTSLPRASARCCRLLSATTWQAMRAFNLIRGIFASAPALASLIESETVDTLRLSNAVDIECRPASFRTIRGATAIAFIADEVGFWFSRTSPQS